MLRMLGVLASVGLLVGVANAADTPVKPTKEWPGKFPDDKDLPLMKLAPAGGFIADKAAFEKLWKAWRPKEETPKIDFEKELVLVGTTQCAGNRIGAALRLDAKGDLKAAFFATQIAGPGFAYTIVVINREGVKTVDGKPIAKE